MVGGSVRVMRFCYIPTRHVGWSMVLTPCHGRHALGSDSRQHRAGGLASGEPPGPRRATAPGAGAAAPFAASTRSVERSFVRDSARLLATNLGQAAGDTVYSRAESHW